MVGVFPAVVFFVSVLWTPATAAARGGAPQSRAEQSPQQAPPRVLQQESPAEARKQEAHRKSIEVGRLIALGDLKQAEALAREAVAADPENPETHYALGLCLEATGRLDEAVAEYKKMGLDAPEPLLELSLARVFLRQGKLDEAEGQSRLAVAKNRWVPQPHLSLGAVAMRKRDYKTAIEAFSAAVEVEPRDWNARISLGDAYRAVGRFDEALIQYTQALALKPDHPQALLGRAEAWEQLGRWADAVGAYEKALEADPEMVLAEYRLAHLYNTVPDPALQKRGRAIELALKAAEATEWRNLRILEILAVAYERAGQADKAREVRKKASQIPAGK